MENETWKGIEGFPKYEVSNLGRVRSYQRGDEPRLLVAIPHPGGYLFVNLYNGDGQAKTLVHQLVAAAFHGERPDGMVCRHLNGVPSDNRAENVVWGTPSENGLDSIRHGTASVTGGRLSRAFTGQEALSIWERAQNGERPFEIAKDYPHVSPSTVRRVARGQGYRKVIAAHQMGEAA